MPPASSASSNQQSSSSNQFSTLPFEGVAPSARNDQWPNSLPPSSCASGVYQRKFFQRPGSFAGRTMKTPFLRDSKPSYADMPKEASTNEPSPSITARD